MLEIVSLFMKNTAVGRWISAAGLKTLMWLILAVALAVVGYFIYNKYETLQAQVKSQAATITSQNQAIGQKDQTIADQKSAIDTLNTQLKLAAQTMQNTDKAEKNLVAVVTTNQVKHDAQATQLHSYVKTVEDSTTINDDQKSELITASYIENLWTGHCGLTDGSNPICARYAPAPSEPAATPPATAAPSVVTPPTPTPISQESLHSELMALMIDPLPVAETV